MKRQIITTILRILPVAVPALGCGPLWAAFVSNPSFEDNYNTTWPGSGNIDSWTTAGTGYGVNESTGPFFNVGTLIPDRDRVAYLARSASMSQSISGLTPGQPYWLQFWYEGRDCCGGTVSVAVSFDGAQIGAISGAQRVTGGYDFANVVFTPTNDTGVLTFQTTASGDASVTFDAVNIVQRDPNNVILMNPSFEASGPPTAMTGNPPAADSGEIIKPARIAGWTWDANQAGTYGVSLAGGMYGDNGAVPDQDLVGFIAGPGSLSQTVSNLYANTSYTLSFAYNAQSAPGVNAHLQVEVAGSVVADEEVAPVGGLNPYHVKTVNFVATNATAEITFAQTRAGGTLLLDDVRLVGKVPPVTKPTPLTFSPTAMELAGTQIDQFQVTVPPDFLAASAADVSITSDNLAVVGVVGANADGVLTLHFAQGTNNVQTFQVVGLGRGSTSLSVSGTDGLVAEDTLLATVVTSLVLNPSFEASGPGVMPIPHWTGGSGVNNASGPTLDNGIVPDQAQVAVLEGTPGYWRVVSWAFPSVHTIARSSRLAPVFAQRWRQSRSWIRSWRVRES